MPRHVGEYIAQVEMLSATPGEAMQRIKNKFSYDVSNVLQYQGTDVKKPDGRRALQIEHTPKAYQDHFTSTSFEEIISGTSKYLKRRFADFEIEPLSQFTTLFDFKGWPKSFSATIEEKRWGLDQLEILTEFYVKNFFITSEESSLALRHWPLFRTRVSKCRNQALYDVYSDLLKENDDDIKGMLLMLELMMTFSGSTAACERGFSSMNWQKTNLRTTMAHETLVNVIRINVDGGACADFNPTEHVESWLRNTKGTRHLKGHQAPTKHLIS